MSAGEIIAVLDAGPLIHLDELGSSVRRRAAAGLPPGCRGLASNYHQR